MGLFRPYTSLFAIFLFRSDQDTLTEGCVIFLQTCFEIEFLEIEFLDFCISNSFLAVIFVMSIHSDYTWASGKQYLNLFFISRNLQKYLF